MSAGCLAVLGAVQRCRRRQTVAIATTTRMAIMSAPHRPPYTYIDIVCLFICIDMLICFDAHFFKPDQNACFSWRQITGIKWNYASLEDEHKSHFFTISYVIYLIVWQDESWCNQRFEKPMSRYHSVSWLGFLSKQILQNIIILIVPWNIKNERASI